MSRYLGSIPKGADGLLVMVLFSYLPVYETGWYLGTYLLLLSEVDHET